MESREIIEPILRRMLDELIEQIEVILVRLHYDENDRGLYMLQQQVEIFKELADVMLNDLERRQFD